MTRIVPRPGIGVWDRCFQETLDFKWFPSFMGPEPVVRPYGPNARRVVRRPPSCVKIRRERDATRPRRPSTPAVVLAFSEDGASVHCGPVRFDAWTGETRPHGNAIWCPRPRGRTLELGQPVVIALLGQAMDGTERWGIEP